MWRVYRTLNLTTLNSTILTKITKKKIEKAINVNLRKNQFRFKENIETREATLVLRIII